MSRSEDKRREYYREYYLKNREKHIRKQMEYYWKNKEKICEKRKEYDKWYYRNIFLNREDLKAKKKERQREYWKKYYKEHRGEILAKRKQ